MSEGRKEKREWWDPNDVTECDEDPPKRATHHFGKGRQLRCRPEE
jgi:hypothetical protein